MDILVFTNYIKSLRLPLATQTNIIEKYIEVQRNADVNKRISNSTNLNMYINQIITMFKTNPDLPTSTYTKYIKFVIEQIARSSGLLEELTKKD